MSVHDNLVFRCDTDPLTPRKNSVKKDVKPENKETNSCRSPQICEGNTKPLAITTRARRRRLKTEDDASDVPNTATDATKKNKEKCSRPRKTRSVDAASAADTTCPQQHSSVDMLVGMRLRNRKTLEPLRSSLTPTSPALNPTPANPNTPEADGSANETNDVYEFRESEGEESVSSSCKMAGEVHDIHHAPLPLLLNAESTAQNRLVSSPSRLKLTLRMKRSPVLDEVIESGNALGKEGRPRQQLHVVPIYEVFRVEGLGDIEGEIGNNVGEKRICRTQQGSSTPAVPPTAKRLTPVTKRLRLIFGNESRTIDLPPVSSSVGDLS